MKKIHDQLRNIFPDKYVTVEHIYCTLSNGKSTVTCKAYVSDMSNEVFSDWTPAFKTAGELDSYLADKINNYKKVY